MDCVIVGDEFAISHKPAQRLVFRNDRRIPVRPMMENIYERLAKTTRLHQVNCARWLRMGLDQSESTSRCLTICRKGMLTSGYPAHQCRQNLSIASCKPRRYALASSNSTAAIASLNCATSS